MRRNLVIIVAVGAVVLIGGLIVIRVACADGDDRSTERAGTYTLTKLVSNVSGAAVTDTNLINPWGMAFAPGQLLWVANNGSVQPGGSGRASTYNGEGAPGPTASLGQANPAWKPTGIVWNPIREQFKGAGFVLDSEDGRIVTLDPVAMRVTEVTRDPKAVYKGLAFGTNKKDGNLLFATNFAGREVEVYDSNFKEISHDGKHGRMFHDPNLPATYAPFGIEKINGELFVTFAERDPKTNDDVPGPGKGFVDVFDTDGRLVRRFASRGTLNAPWGVAFAPLSFGRFGGALLIGNFGDGTINAFDYASGKFLGQLRRSSDGKVITINGLWALKFGEFKDAEPSELYFTAGINDEAGGLIGEIAAAGRRPARD